jgi:hypothetical protein
MNLPDFIRSHREQIIEEWEAFARTRLPAAAQMSQELLRDHAGQLVDAVAADMEVLQSPHEEAERDGKRIVLDWYNVSLDVKTCRDIARTLGTTLLERRGG